MMSATGPMVIAIGIMIAYFLGGGSSNSVEGLYGIAMAQ